MINGAHLRLKHYNVLPVKRGAKHCRIPGWNMLDDWEGKAPGLGLNLVGLAMIDIDLDLPYEFPAERDKSSDIVDDLIELADSDDVYRSAWRYRGDSARRAILVRCEDVEHARLTTSKFSVGRIEFKIGRGEFLFGWGTHPSGSKLVWTWRDDMSPVIDPESFPPKHDLPCMSFQQLQQWRDRAESALSEMFGDPVGPQRDFEAMKLERDLSWDMVFTRSNGREATLKELYNGPGTSEFVNLTPWRSDSDSMGGHIVHSYLNEGPTVTDFVTGVVHALPDSWAEFDEDVVWPEDLDMPELDATKQMRENLSETADRMNRLVFVRDVNRFVYVDDPTGLTMTKEAAFSELGPKDRAEMARQTRAVDRQIWDPTQPGLSIIRNDSRRWLEHNSFAVPTHAESSNDLNPVSKFMARFIPDQYERSVILQWLAFKAHNPGVRGFSVVLVGPEGSGKGTFWGLIEKLWGHDYVANVGGIGAIYDARYDDVLYRRLWVLIDEVAADDAGYIGKRAAKERLKAFCEPHATWKVLNLKGKQQVHSRVCATVGFATNNIDALPLSKDDRRFFVASTGDEMAPHEVEEIQSWARHPENIASFWHSLRAVDLGGFNMMRAPASQAKADMAAANESDVDTSYANYQNMVRACGGYYTAENIRTYVQNSGLDIREMQALKRLLTTWCVRRVARVGGKSTRYYVTKEQSGYTNGAHIKSCLEKLEKAIADGQKMYTGD